MYVTTLIFITSLLIMHHAAALEDCLTTISGYQYSGVFNVTQSGKTCQKWAAPLPHSNPYQNSTIFPDGSAIAAGNNCRNPTAADGNYNAGLGVWCFTTDPNLEWEPCSVPLCGINICKYLLWEGGGGGCGQNASSIDSIVNVYHGFNVFFTIMTCSHKLRSTN